jgi:hypothetical protein
MATEVRTTPQASGPETRDDRGDGLLVFAGIMILVLGVLNVIHGIAAIDNANIYVNDAQFVFSDLETWGWILLALGVLQVCAAFSIWAGGVYGQWFGIFAASLNAIGALLLLPAYPFYALAIFAIDVAIIYGLAAYGGRRRLEA